MNHNYYQKTRRESGFFWALYNKVSRKYESILTHKESPFKKVLLFFIGGILFTPALWSQSFLEEMNARFRYVQPKDGPLISSFIPMVNLDGMGGQQDSDTSNYETSQETLRLALLQQYGIAHYDSMRLIYEARQQQFLANGVIALGIVDMRYQDVNPLLEQEGRITIGDDSSFRFNLNGFTESVYLEKYLLSVVSPIERLRSDVVFAVLDSQLVLSNFHDWKNMNWMWVSGDTRIHIDWNVPFMLPKTGAGGPIVGTLQCELAENNERSRLFETPWYLSAGRLGLLANFKLFMNFPNGSAPDLLAQNDLSVHYYIDAVKPSMKAMYTVHLGYGEFGKVRTCMERPIIIVEGVDYGYPGYPAGFRDQKYGENGYIDLLKGKNWDVPSQIWKNWESISQGPVAIERLRKAGFDIVYVDFWDGAQDMNNNAEVLIGVIKKVQQQMCAREIHVLGVSMGGVIAKRAIRQMENRGISHCIVSFTSFDAPHQGANLSLGLQNVIKYYKGTLRVCDDLHHRIIRRTASEQLLVNHETSSYREAGLRRLWVREDSLFGGYPEKPWLFAISNGSSKGTRANMNFSSTEKLQPGMPLMRLQLKTMLLFGWVNNYLVDIYAENFYDRKHNAYYNGRINMGRKFYSHKDNLLWDHVPGSMMKQFQIFEHLGKTMFLKNGFLSDQSCFIPTVSSLDLKSTGLNLQNIVEKDFAVNTGDMSQVLSNDMQTPFQRVYIPEANQEHIKLDTSKGGNIDWLIAQLSDVSGANDVHTVLEDYNLRSPHSRNLKGLTVAKKGMFELNGVGTFPAWSRADSLLAGSAQERVFYAGDCAGARFSVRDSGLFIIGKHVQATKFILGGNSVFEVKHSGELRIVKGGNRMVLKSGTELHLSDDAVLRIEDGSQLIVESGAVLRISDRAKVYVQGSAALFHVKGRLILDSGVRFQPIPGIDGVVGLVKFTNVGYGFGDAQVEAYGARMIFEGNGKNGARSLQVEGAVRFPEVGAGKDLTRLDITRSVVCFGPASRAYFKGRVSVTDSRMEPVEWSNAYCGGFHFVGNQGRFENLEFYRQDTALYYEQQGSNAISTIKGISFAECLVGFHIETSFMHVSRMLFESNEIGLSMHNIWKEGVIEQSKFYKNQIAVKASNTAETYGQLLSLNNEFYENHKGYALNKVTAFLNCHHFGGNESGIIATESSLRLDGALVLESALLNRKFSAGLNVFTNQTGSAIELDHSEIWANGSNYFHNNRSTYKGQAFIAGDYRLVKSASYFDPSSGRVHLGSNRFFPSHAKFIADSLNGQYIRLKHNGFPLLATANLMKVYEGATCAIERDPTDVLSAKYLVDEKEEDANFPKSDGSAMVIGGSGKLKVNVQDAEVWIYATNGVLLKRAKVSEEMRELIVPTGLYFVHVEATDINRTEKVFVEP